MDESELVGARFLSADFIWWQNVLRPGYFGRRRDFKTAGFDIAYGKDQWKLAWVHPSKPDGDVRSYDFKTACVLWYEKSYLRWFQQNPQELDYVCSFGECIDNAPTNVQSGTSYEIQEAFSTHIQDIAVRNVLRTFDRKFEGPADKILVIRSRDSEGFKYGPGNIPFHGSHITQPSKCPEWADPGSVEDFWQSNKWLQIKVS